VEPPLRAIFLDLDNTLWDVEPVLERAEQALGRWLASHYPRIGARYSSGEGQRLRREIAAAHPHLSHDLTWLRSESLRRLAAEESDPALIAEQALAIFLAARNEIEPYPEVRPALARLAARLPLYAISNGNADIGRVGLGELFAGAVGAAEAGAAKPDPRIFRYLLARARLEPSTVLHVGDDPAADIGGARSAGLRTAWMNRAGARWPDSLARADHEIADLDGLVRLLAA
jgi:2-haloalkanoic acid dehalogenase type II